MYFLPPDAELCALFVDGSRIKISRPSGSYWKQRAGDKWYHCRCVQGTFGPDGMFYDWWDRPLGRFPDRYFMNDSNLNARLRNSQLALFVANHQYWAYTDKGYRNSTHVRAAAHGPGHVTAEHRSFEQIF